LERQSDGAVAERPWCDDEKRSERAHSRAECTGVHINIEHVDVISCERRQLVSEVPMRKSVGLVEAPRGSPWSEALDSADCKQLMNLLQENPCRVVQKGKAGSTVLHAAARRGCLKLLDQVFDLFEDKYRFVDEEEGIELSLQELLKAESIYRSINHGSAIYYGTMNEEGIGEARLTAAEYAWWSMGACDAGIHLRVSGLPGPRVTFFSYQRKIFGSSIDPVAADEESSSPQHLLRGVLADHRSLLSNTTHYVFSEDLKYNFVVDCEELRFHHACQYVGKIDCREYVEAVIGGCVEKGPHVLKYLFQLRNAQGQTPLHLAMDNGSLVPLIPGCESGENAECLNMRDSRGWTALHFASAQDYRKDLRELLEDGRADVNAKVDFIPVSWDSTSVTCIRATPLYLAVIHNSSKAVERLLQDPRTHVNARFHRLIYFDDSLCVNRPGRRFTEWTALQLAAVAGLPEMVKVLMTCPKVCVCLHINPSMTKDTFN
jgi:hypothetical protein